MTRVWTNVTHSENRTPLQNGNHPQGEMLETNFNSSETAQGHSNDTSEVYDKKLQYLNGNEKHFESIHNSRHLNGINDESEKVDGKKSDSFFGLHWDKDLEKELAEQSRLMLKMIYFFQVLPFYILQFTSGMALGTVNDFHK